MSTTKRNKPRNKPTTRCPENAGQPNTPRVDERTRPAPDTRNRADHTVPFTYQVPSRSRTQTIVNPSTPLRDRNFSIPKGVPPPQP